MSAVEIKVPDIGDFSDVPVIEIFVKPGDTVAAEDSLVTLESDKATMDVPSPSAGTVKSVGVKVGDKVSEGTVIVVLDVADAGAAKPVAAPSPAPGEKPEPSTAPCARRTESASARWRNSGPLVGQLRRIESRRSCHRNQPTGIMVAPKYATASVKSSANISSIPVW